MRTTLLTELKMAYRKVDRLRGHSDLSEVSLAAVFDLIESMFINYKKCPSGFSFNPNDRHRYAVWLSYSFINSHVLYVNIAPAPVVFRMSTAIGSGPFTLFSEGCISVESAMREIIRKLAVMRIKRVSTTKKGNPAAG